MIWIIELEVNGKFFPAVDFWFDAEADARDYIVNEGLDEAIHRVVPYARTSGQESGE